VNVQSRRDWTTVAVVIRTIALLAGWGCSTPLNGPTQPRPPLQSPIARIEAIEGTDVTVAGRRAEPNMDVFENEEVKTGSHSKVTIRFAKGGLMWLDENTDPVFALVSQTLCILISIFQGHAQIDSGGQCFQAATPESEAFLSSKVDMRIQGGRATWKVLEGRILVVSKVNHLDKREVAAGQLAVVSRSRVETLTRIPEPELGDLRNRFLQIRAPMR